ncbi:hypothetical protein H5410_063936, partial [Solanum commersonii]
MGYAVMLLIVFLCHEVSSISILPHKHQTISLLKFKQSFTIHPSSSYNCPKPYPKTSSWNTSRDCCSWDGVVCDDITGHVIELDLSCSNLTGTIDSNSSLFQLSHLQRLDLSFNKFSNSHISPEFGKFSSLKHLHLSHSYFSGQIPSEISHLSKLHSLRLSSIYDSKKLRLTTHDFKSLLQNLTQLRELDLSGINISSTIPLNFSSHLTTLILSETGLYGIIPESIFHLPNLETLDLSDNDHLNGYFPKTKWNSSASLIELDLSGVNFSCNLPESLGYHLTSVRYLFLQSCNLRGPIPESLSNLTRIVDVIPSITKDNTLELTACDVKELEFLRSAKQLRQLDLSNNKIEGRIPDWAWSNWMFSLQDFNISHNMLTSVDSIPLQSVDTIDLRSNLLQDDEESNSEFLSDFRKAAFMGYGSGLCIGISIVYFMMSTGKPIWFARIISDFWKGALMGYGSGLCIGLSIIYFMLSTGKPIWLARIIFFTLLYLLTVTFASIEEATSLLKWKATFKNHNNSLFASWTPSSNSCRDWYGVICLNGRVNTLNITNSSVIGTLYAFPFSSLPFLEYFELSLNNISGIIPPEIGNLTNLVYLDLSMNQISGTIPPQIGSLAKLEILHIFDNHLSGFIPQEIGYLRSLTELALYTNFLNGSIPASLGNLNNLSYLYLYDNHLSGSIPKEIGKLVNLVGVSLDTNQLTGHIPPEIGNLTNAKLFYAPCNELSGPIPAEIGKMKSLQELILHTNNLSGLIPKTIGDLTELKYLQLYDNQLSGLIPREMGNLKNLNGLELFNNQLFGLIPNTNDTVSGLDDEESNSEFQSDFWKGALMGYGSGLCIGLSIIYFMLSTGKPIWLARII